MAGIYFHIPFCKSKCTYCDFFKITDFSQQDELYELMLLELQQRENYITEQVETIYFGGGTPSTFAADKIAGLLNKVKQHYQLADKLEVTLEANPDDLSLEYLQEMHTAGVNRLSMGIQSFDEKQLIFINRRHTRQQAIDAVELARKAGFENISIDLIYGLPFQDFESWKEQVRQALELNVAHISAYGLMYEEGTALYRQMQAGIVKPADDDTMNAMYHYLVKTCSSAGYEQYEISNYARNGMRSQHNTAYWDDNPYLGIGPAAHSFNRVSRQWNVASVDAYCRKMNVGEDLFEKEVLSEQDRYNDFIMVSLRKMIGIELKKLKSNFDEKFYQHCISNAELQLKSGTMELTETHLRLTQAGVLLSDTIIVELMYV